MAAVTRKGDNCSGHGCYPPRPSTQGSPDVFVNGIPVVRLGDAYDVHCCGPLCHNSTLSEGSSSVYVNGKPVGRIGDLVACGSAVAIASSDTFMGGDRITAEEYNSL